MRGGPNVGLYLKMTGTTIFPEISYPWKLGLPGNMCSLAPTRCTGNANDHQLRWIKAKDLRDPRQAMGEGIPTAVTHDMAHKLG